MSVTDKIRLWNSLCAFLPLLLYDSWTKRRRHLEIRHFMSIVRDSNLLSSLSGNNSAKTSVVLKDRDPLQLCTTHMSLTFFWLISFSKPARLIKVQQLLKSIWEIFEAVVGVARRQGGVRLAAVRMCRFLKLDSCVLLIPASAVRCGSVTSSAGFTAPSYQALSTFTPTLVYITSFIHVFACIHYQYFGLLCHYYGWIKNSSLYTDLSLIYTFHCVHCFMPTESYTSPCWTDRVLVTQCTYISFISNYKPPFYYKLPWLKALPGQTAGSCRQPICREHLLPNGGSVQSMWSNRSVGCSSSCCCWSLRAAENN